MRGVQLRWEGVGEGEMVHWGKPKIISALQLYFSLKMNTMDTLVILVIPGLPMAGDESRMHRFTNRSF